MNTYFEESIANQVERSVKYFFSNQTNRTVIRSNPSIPPDNSSPTVTGTTPARVPV